MVSVRRLTLDDKNTMYEYASDFENTYYMLNNPIKSVEEVEEFIEKCIKEYDIEKPNFLSFAVEYNNVHVGEVFATILKDETIIGWIINKKYWKKGIATSAAKWLINYLTEELFIKNIISYCDARNIASKKIMEKLGMKFICENGPRYYKKDVTQGIELKYQMI